MSDQLKDKVASHVAFSDIFYTVELFYEERSFIVCFSYDRGNDERNRIKVKDYHNDENISFDNLFDIISDEKEEELFEEVERIEQKL